MQHNAIWQEFLSIIREEAGSRVVDTWFKALLFERWDGEEKTVYLKAPNTFVRNWIQKHYMSMMQLHLGRLLHVDMPRVLFCNSNPPEKSAEKEPPLLTGQEKKQESLQIIPASVTHGEVLIRSRPRNQSSINPNYTIESFVVGPNNSLAHAAAHAIIEQPGSRYNPLFIYGGSGLGKTHLMHAIGNAIQYRYKKAVVLYQTADRFVSEFIAAIRFNKVHKFQEKYHSIDILLIDDMQFIAHKEHTQEAFFHIFNALYDAHKQIVFSSDTFPQDLKGVAERLRSRLAAGLVTDIHEPSLETKIAILKKKALMHHDMLDDEVSHFIALHARGNIRELEGALIRVMAFASLTKQPVSLDLAQKVLVRSGHMEQKKDITFDAIIKKVEKYYSITYKDLCSKNRNKEIADVRHITMFLMKKLTVKSLRDIGHFLGGRDHSTVMHGIERVEIECTKSGHYAEQIKKLEHMINQS